MRKTIIWIFAMILLVGNIYAQEAVTQPQQEQTSYHDESFYTTTDSSTWDSAQIDWDKIPPEKVTAEQLSYGDNLQRAGDLGRYNKEIVKQALSTKSNGAQIAVSSGVTVNTENLEAESNGVPLNLESLSSTDVVESVPDGWLVNGKKITGVGIQSLNVNPDGTFNVDGNTVTFTGTGDQTYSQDENGNVRVTNGIVSGTEIRGTDYMLEGQGSIAFDDAGNVVSASIEPHEGKHSVFTYGNTQVSTTSTAPVSIFRNENEFNKGSGNRVFIGDNVVAGNGAFQLVRDDLTVQSRSQTASMRFEHQETKDTLTAHGQIIIEDSATRYTGLNDATDMTKDTRASSRGREADLFTVNGPEGDLARVDKKITVSVGRVPVPTSVGTTITRNSDGISFNVDRAQLQHFAQLMNSPNSVALVERELYVNGGENEGYFGFNAQGMGRFENTDGTISSNIFPPSLSQRTLGGAVVAVNQNEAEQLQKLYSSRVEDLRAVDFNILNQNPQLQNYVQRNLQLDITRLENALKNPDSPEGQRYLTLISTSNTQLEEGLKQLSDAGKIKDAQQQQTAGLAAERTLLQSQINLNIANGRNVEDLVRQRSDIDVYQRLVDSGKLSPTEQISELKKLRDDPQYHDSAQRILAQVYSSSAQQALQGTAGNRLSIAATGLRFALQNDPDNTQLQEQRQTLDVAVLQTIKTGVGSSREQQVQELEQKFGTTNTVGGIFTNLLRGTGTSVAALTDYNHYFSDLGDTASQEQQRLATEQVGVDLISRLREKGFSWEQIQSASSDPIRLAEAFNIQDIHSQDPDQRHAASVMADQLRQNVEQGLRNPDVQRLARPTGEQFTFETGGGYLDSSYLETGGIAAHAFDIVDSATSVLGALSLAPGAVVGGGVLGTGTIGLRTSATLSGRSLLEAASAVRIGGNIGRAGDSLLAPVQGIGNAFSSVGSGVSQGVVSAMRISGIADSAAARGAAQAFTSAKNFFTSVSDRYTQFEAGVFNAVENAPGGRLLLFTGQTGEELAAEAAKGSQLIIEGQAYAVESTESGTILRNANPSLTDDVLDISQIRNVQGVVRDGKLDAEATNELKALFLRDTAAAGEADLAATTSERGSGLFFEEGSLAPPRPDKVRELTEDEFNSLIASNSEDALVGCVEGSCLRFAEKPPTIRTEFDDPNIAPENPLADVGKYKRKNEEVTFSGFRATDDEVLGWLSKRTDNIPQIDGRFAQNTVQGVDDVTEQGLAAIHLSDSTNEGSRFVFKLRGTSTVRKQLDVVYRINDEGNMGSYLAKLDDGRIVEWDSTTGEAIASWDSNTGSALKITEPIPPPNTYERAPEVIDSEFREEVALYTLDDSRNKHLLNLPNSHVVLDQEELDSIQPVLYHIGIEEIPRDRSAFTWMAKDIDQLIEREGFRPVARAREILMDVYDVDEEIAQSAQGYLYEVDIRKLPPESLVYVQPERLANGYYTIRPNVDFTDAIIRKRAINNVGSFGIQVEGGPTYEVIPQVP